MVWGRSGDAGRVEETEKRESCCQQSKIHPIAGQCDCYMGSGLSPQLVEYQASSRCASQRSRPWIICLSKCMLAEGRRIMLNPCTIRKCCGGRMKASPSPWHKGDRSEMALFPARKPGRMFPHLHNQWNYTRGCEGVGGPWSPPWIVQLLAISATAPQAYRRSLSLVVHLEFRHHHFLAETQLRGEPQFKILSFDPVFTTTPAPSRPGERAPKVGISGRSMCYCIKWISDVQRGLCNSTLSSSKLSIG